MGSKRCRIIIRTEKYNEKPWEHSVPEAFACMKKKELPTHTKELIEYMQYLG